MALPTCSVNRRCSHRSSQNMRSWRPPRSGDDCEGSSIVNISPDAARGRPMAPLLPVPALRGSSSRSKRLKDKSIDVRNDDWEPSPGAAAAELERWSAPALAEPPPPPVAAAAAACHRSSTKEGHTKSAAPPADFMESFYSEPPPAARCTSTRFKARGYKSPICKGCHTTACRRRATSVRTQIGAIRSCSTSCSTSCHYFLCNYISTRRHHHRLRCAAAAAPSAPDFSPRGGATSRVCKTRGGALRGERLECVPRGRAACHRRRADGCYADRAPGGQRREGSPRCERGRERAGRAAGYTTGGGRTAGGVEPSAAPFGRVLQGDGHQLAAVGGAPSSPNAARSGDPFPPQPPTIHSALARLPLS